MTKQTILKIAGVACTVIGAGLLYLSGAGESMVSALVGGVFILIALIAAFFKK